MRSRSAALAVCALLVTMLVGSTTVTAFASSFDGEWVGTLLNSGARYNARVHLTTSVKGEVTGTMNLIRIGSGMHASYRITGTYHDRTLTYRTTLLTTASRNRWCAPGGYLHHEVDQDGVTSLAGRLQENVRGGGCSALVTGAIRFYRPSSR